VELRNYFRITLIPPYTGQRLSANQVLCVLLFFSAFKI